MDEYNVKIYTYIDELSHRIEPSEVYGDETEKEMEIVADLFKKNGWEGDGDIKLIWIPPFMCRYGDTIGEYIWHVKQGNNGISFLAYKGKFPFISEDYQPINFVDTKLCSDVDGFKNQIKKYQNTLDLIDLSLNNDLINITINGFHADIIASFNDFINYFSLEIFHELIMENNPYKIKINYKPNFTLSIKNILDNCDGMPDGTYDEDFVFQFQLIQSLYDNFKFEPYEERIKMVCKAYDFDFRPKYGCELRKQVEIRNSFQHRDGMLDKKSYQAIGSRVYILQDDGTRKEIHELQSIELTLAEVKNFLTVLDEFCDDFKAAIKTKYENYRMERILADI